MAHITYERSAVAGLGQGGYLVNTTEHILLYKKGALPGKTNLSYEELGFNIIKRYNRYISNFGDRTLIREFVAKSNDEIVRVYEHSGVEIESISLRDVKNRETEIRQEFIVHLDTLFRGNRVQKENEFQNAIIASFHMTYPLFAQNMGINLLTDGLPTLFHTQWKYLAVLKKVVYRIFQYNALTTLFEFYRHPE